MLRTTTTLLLLLILIGACQSIDQQQDLVGVWNDGFTFMQFEKDGTWGTAGMYESISTNRPITFGTYLLEDTLLTFETDEASNFCPGGVGTYEIEFSNQGELTFTPIEEECRGRNFDLTRGSYVRYSL